MKRTGLEASLKAGGEEELERLDNLRELVSLAREYDTLTPEEAVEQLLENAALQSDQDELKNAKDDQDTVKLMTIHAAKGLEFPYVFITGLEEGLFPHERMEGGEHTNSSRDEEEERRLFYVALTRAKKKVFLTYATMRTIFGSQRVNVPSSFLLDIKEEHLEFLNPVGLSGFERTVYLD
jgi:DNA helicase-2/ATP-dependent DNA helicase PcrA